MLTEQSPLSWTTTILIDESPSCLPGLSYQLVTTSPDYLVNGTPTGTAAVGPVAGPGVIGLDPVSLNSLDRRHLGPGCAKAAGADSEVSLKFPLTAPFPTVPLGATLVVNDPGGPVPAAATQLMTVHALVTGWQYLWFPLIYGGVMVALFLFAVGLVPLGRLVWKRKLAPSGRGFWRRPVYASAAWTFTDSPATNISALGTILAAILAAAGATSTLLPGVQVDHFAILIAVCAAIVGSAPLAFGIINTWFARSRGSVPDNASLRFTSNVVELGAPAGASLTFAGQAEAVNTAHAPVPLKPGGTVPVPPGSKIKITLDRDTGAAVFPGDSSIVLNGVLQVELGDTGQGEFTVPADALPAPAAPGAAVPGAPAPVGGAASAPAQPVTLGLGLPIKPAQTRDGVTVKAVGFVTVTVPKWTTVKYPFPDYGTEKRFTRATILRVPMGSNVIAADMRSLIPASMVTIFGIGAQLGLLTILGSELSAVSGSVHLLARLVVGAMAAVLLSYAVIATIALASSRPGSALASDSQTSYIL